MSRDAEKRRLCFSRGISLITVPFWWNGQLSSLASSIVELRPDLIHYIDKNLLSTSIPKHIPESYRSISSVPFVKVEAEEYTNQNIKNYLMMEKYNGIRVYLERSPTFTGQRYFDGRSLRSSHTKQVISFPSHLINQLPGVPFEAELMEKTGTLKVFDSADTTKFQLGYAERVKYLRQRIDERTYALLRYIYLIWSGFKWWNLFPFYQKTKWNPT